MEATRILIIGRSPAGGLPFVAAFKKRYTVWIAESGKSALDLARQVQPHAVVLDAISMRTPGDRICLDLRSILPTVPMIHIHPGPKDQVKSVADVLLFQPATPRRLLAILDSLMQASGDDVVTCGPFALNLGRRVLIVEGQEIQLTPKQALLVETFFTNPGVTLDRLTLMERVWQTDYVGDTRTLDVHIRWVRQMIEPDPSHPRYLLTVRGVGYRLETSLEFGVDGENDALALALPKD